VVAQTTLEVIELLLDSSALLDPRCLAAGNWAFVSFPAYLMARSLTETLANPDQRFFSDDYWEQGSHRPEEYVEEQRTILRYLELQRARSANGGEAKPIRYVYVGWGLIKLEGKFLMHHREDRARPEARNYVFPGGRLNASDLPVGKRGPEALPELFQSVSPLAMEFLPKTLERELNEELKLIVGEDYSHELFLTLAPFRQVEGARNNHALTEYGINLFQIRLTSKGEAALYDRVCNEPGRFSWFSAEDLARQTLPDGRSAYIDALKSTLGNDVQSSLENVPDSSSFQPRFSGENQLLTIPSSPDRPFLFGKTGKETSIQIAMTNDQWDLLFTLAWYRKGLELKPDSNEASLLPSGWVKLNDSGQMTQAKQFATDLADAGLPLIEITGDVYLRIAVEKSNLFFDDDLYSYSLDREGDKDGILEVSTHAINTRWGTIHSSKVAVPVTKNICRVITAIQQGLDPDSQPNIRGEDLQRDLREKIDTRTRKIGLRKFIRIESGQYIIAPISAP
jgi:8-oxo-dGTP pyrophosphatase MutT (NUDIX family)